MLKLKLVVPVASAALMSVPGAAFAAPPDRAEKPFVCPVLTVSGQAVEQSGRFNPLGNGQYTFAPGAAGSADTFNGNVPDNATNSDGAGSPEGIHAAPGDGGYTAVWSGDN
jgi:ABC-type phosphate transport system substrate-binding protein